jgi:Zn-dependent protease with chaperone function
MFAVRGIAVSLTFFVLLYCLLSLLVAIGWRSLKLVRAPSERSPANLLFTLRILPQLASTLITLAFVLPSYLRLEPTTADEDTGILPLVFGICALSLFAYGLWRVVSAQTRASRVVASWLEGADPLDADAKAATFRSQSDVLPLTLVGVFKSRVLVSNSAVALLSGDELHIALKHEMAHLRSHDNLKKLIFRFSPFPGMARLETAWSQAAELAADDAAVSSLHDAIDLAAALVKLSRLVSVEAAPACTVGFVTGSIRARVARLLAWGEGSHTQEVRIFRWYVLPPAVAASLCIFVTYGPALALTHQVTEWLVR